jgi:hypothetical protein
MIAKSRRESHAGTSASYLSRLWYGDCIIPMMLTGLTAPDLTWLFLAVVVCLLSAAVWAFWEIGNANGIARATVSDRPVVHIVNVVGRDVCAARPT